MRQKRQRILQAFILAGFVLLSNACIAPLMAQDKPQFRVDKLSEFELGNIEPGRYVLKAVVFTMQPRAKIPAHVHKSAGTRYVLEGAISINWKNGTAQTYSAGSTYTEGPGENHPPGVMAASNPTDAVTKVLIIELVRIE